MSRLKSGLSDAGSDALKSIGLSGADLSQTIGSDPRSAGTHAKDGLNPDGTPYTAAVDIRISGRTADQIKTLLGKLADVGYAAWYRAPNWDGKNGSAHIHAIYAGVRMKASLQKQVHAWLDGFDGLAGEGGRRPYHFWSPTQIREDLVRWYFLSANPAVYGGPVVKPNWPKPGTVAVTAVPAISPAFEAALKHVLASEGGYSDDPSDAGGPTKYGITQATLSAFLGRQASVDEVKELTAEKVAPIYRQKYWDKMQLGRITSAKAAALLFDQGVNRGALTVVKDAQAVVGAAQDGDLGPVTAGLINSMKPENFVREFLQVSQLKYVGIVQANPTQVKFLKGWTNRLHSIWDYVTT